MRVKVKISGVTSPEEAMMLNRYGADYAGFVMFYEKSEQNNTVQNAWQVLRYLDRKIQKVAVVVAPTIEQIRMIQQMDFQAVQIHGTLSTEVLEEIKLPIWRAYDLEERIVPEEVSHPKISAYILEGKKTGKRKVIDWKALESFDRGDKMLVLAGDLSEENVQEAIKTLQPDIVDMNGGVEGEHGKDAVKMKHFIEKVKKSF